MSFELPLTLGVLTVAFAALTFPIALTVAESQQFAPRGMMMCITFTASMAFITPIGYQTTSWCTAPATIASSTSLGSGDSFRCYSGSSFWWWLR